MFRASFQTNRPLWTVRVCGFALIAALLAMSSGCSLLDTCGGKIMPAPPVNEVTALWYEQVQVVQDPINGGRPLPGLVGRVYLGSGDAKKVMVEANGMFHVDMWDETPGAESRKLADWMFDNESLKHLRQNDFIGKGYTIFLPWETYRPEVKKVQIRMCYVEPGKAPHYAEPQRIAIKPVETQPPLVQQINYEYAPAQHELPMPK